MLAYPPQPCPACLQPSVRLCEGAGQSTAPARQDRLVGKQVGLPHGGFLLLGEESDRRWTSERVLLYLCTACRYARLSISGRLVRPERVPVGETPSTGRPTGCRVLVLHHDVRLRDVGDVAGALGDSRNADSSLGDRQEGEGKIRLPPSESRLVQQSVSPAVFVSAELPEEENYTPAEWRYFVGSEEVCTEQFREQLNRAYARFSGAGLDGWSESRSGEKPTCVSSTPTIMPGRN